MLLSADSLEKSFAAPRGARGAPVFSGLSFELRQGEYLALTGPNGAGKSTLLRIIAGLLRPEAGSLRLDGVDLLLVPARRRPPIGYAEGTDRWLHPRLSGRENLAFFVALAGLGRRELEARIEEWSPVLGLSELLERPVRQLSSGQRLRVSLARALLAEPRLLLLDEVFLRLDAETTTAFRAALRTRGEKRGLAVISATHDSEEIQRWANRELRLDGPARAVAAEARSA